MKRRNVAFLLVLLFCSQGADAQGSKEIPEDAKISSPGTCEVDVKTGKISKTLKRHEININSYKRLRSIS